MTRPFPHPANPSLTARLLAALLALGLLLSACRPLEAGPPSAQTPPAGTPGAAETLTPFGPATDTPTPRPSSTPAPSPTPEPSPTSALNLDPESLRGVRVEFWHAWAGEAGAAVRALVDEFNAGNRWGIVVVPTAHFGFDGLAEAAAAAFEPGAATARPGLLVSYAYQDLGAAPLADLGLFLRDPLWGLPPEEAQAFLAAAETGEADEALSGLPAPRSAQFLYYNQTWAQELGFGAAPQTVEEFREQACAAASAYTFDDDPSNDRSGGWIISTHYSAVTGWLYTFGADFLLPEGRGYSFETPEVEESLTFLRELYEAGCAWLSENEFPESEFARRLGLFSTGSLGGLPFQAERMRLEENSDQWTVIPFPAVQGDPVVTLYGPQYRLVEAGQREELAAWLFLRWLLEPENEARLAAGLAAYPTGQAALDRLASDESLLPQYRAALALRPYGREEPAGPSWRLVRWALSDAATQLFRSYFELEQLPATVRLLDRTARELHQGE